MFTFTLTFIRHGETQYNRDKLLQDCISHPGGARSRAAAPPHREEPVEVARASIPDASWTPSSGGVPDTSHREEAQGMAQDTLEGLCLSAGLGTPWAPPGGAGGGVWGEGRLGVSAESAAPATRSRIKRKTTSRSASAITELYDICTCIYAPVRGVDTHLSETGVQQGEAVGRYLRDIKFCKVFVSNLQRAVQTAELILSNNIHCSGMEMFLEPLLRERGFGIAEGRHKQDLKNMANASGQSCRDYTPPGGETLDQVKLRFKNFLQVLFKQMLDMHSVSGQEISSVAQSTNDGASSDISPSGMASDGLHGASAHVLVVSHGAYIRVAIRHLVEDLKCGLPAGEKMSHLFSPCPNTGISRFVVTLSRTKSGPVLSAVQCLFTNRKDHLQNLPDPK